MVFGGVLFSIDYLAQLVSHSRYHPHRVSLSLDPVSLIGSFVFV